MKIILIIIITGKQPIKIFINNSLGISPYLLHKPTGLADLFFSLIIFINMEYLMNVSSLQINHYNFFVAPL